MDDGAPYSIGEAAAESGVPVRTIRYYERIGLIPQARRRPATGQGPRHRAFSATDVGRLKFIRQARLLGLGLGDIRELVAIGDRNGCPGRQPAYGDVLARHLEAIGERIDHLRRLRATMTALMEKAESRGPGPCTWESCGCLDPEAPPGEHDDARSKEEDPR